MSSRRWRWGGVVTALVMVLGAQTLYAAEAGAQFLSADLEITKTDGVVSATPGGGTTYTITASNAGPDPSSATVADAFPAALTATWTCVGAGGGTCTASGSGNISDTVNLTVGGSVTYTVSAAIAAGATGSLSNTATVTAPAGIGDPNPGNNSATDTDTLTPLADLAITKTDGVTSATPGGSTTYTITASNAGPSNAPGATVADTFPAALIATWTCVGAGGGTCTGSGSGNISDTVNLPAGGTVTYTVSAAIAAAATGNLANTATVTAPAGVSDPNPGNNSATDTDTLTPPTPPVVIEPPVVAAPPVVAEPPVVVTAQCKSRRHFTIRLIERRERLIRSAKVFVHGRRVAVMRRRSDHRLVAVVDLRGLPKGTYRVVIKARLRNGHRARWVRSYRTCIEPLPPSNDLDNPRAL